MVEERTMLCEKCRNFFPIAEIKYMVNIAKGKDEKIALCTSCRAKHKLEIPKAKKADPQKTPYFCVRCRYKFKHSPHGETNLKCPFCGKDDKIILDKAPSTERMIKEFK
jgi:Trm5-related predicted tRNA methylase